MNARLVGMLLLSLALCVLSSPAGEDKFARQKNKDKDGLIEPKKDVPKDDNVKAGEKGKKAETKDAKSVTGKIKSVNHQKASFTVTPDAGKDRVFLVTDKTKFLGPRGSDRGTGRDGLKDETMATGYVVRVVPAADGKNAAEVHLPIKK